MVRSNLEFLDFHSKGRERKFWIFYSDPKSMNIRLLNDVELENEDLNLNEIYSKDLSMSKVIISAKIT